MIGKNSLLIFILVSSILGVIFYFSYKNTKNTYIIGYSEMAEVKKIQSIIENYNGVIENHYDNINVFKVKLNRTQAKKLEKEEMIIYVEKNAKVEIK